MRISLLVGLLLCTSVSVIHGMEEEVTMLDGAEPQVVSFDAADTNKDGMLSREEHAAAYASGAAAKPETMKAQMEAAKTLLKSQESLATKYGVGVCEAAFAETTAQCKSLKMSLKIKSHVDVRKMIKDAGTAIVAAVDRAAAAADKASGVATQMAEADKAKFLEVSLGESSGEESYSSGSTAKRAKDFSKATDDPGKPYNVQPSSIQAMTSLGCEQLFAGVENLCAKSKVEKQYGLDSMKKFVKKQKEGLANIAATASQVPVKGNRMKLEEITAHKYVDHSVDVEPAKVEAAATTPATTPAQL